VKQFTIGEQDWSELTRLASQPFITVGSFTHAELLELSGIRDKWREIGKRLGFNANKDIRTIDKDARIIEAHPIKAHRRKLRRKRR